MNQVQKSALCSTTYQYIFYEIYTYTVVDVIIEKKSGKSVGKVIIIFLGIYIKLRILEKNKNTKFFFVYLFSTDLFFFLFDCFSQQEWEMCQIV